MPEIKDQVLDLLVEGIPVHPRPKTETQEYRTPKYVNLRFGPEPNRAILEGHDPTRAGEYVAVRG